MLFRLFATIVSVLDACWSWNSVCVPMSRFFRNITGYKTVSSEEDLAQSPNPQDDQVSVNLVRSVFTIDDEE